jgi:hypothetical protein
LIATTGKEKSIKMSILDERRKAVEELFRREEEVLIKLKARRNRLFGEWAASVLGLSGREAENYAQAVVFAGLQALGDDSLIAMVEQDFRAKAILRSRAQLGGTLYRFAEQIWADSGDGSSSSDGFRPLDGALGRSVQRVTN